MNAIIALCNFCELHGPSILYCTQSFHESDEKGDEPEKREGAAKNSKKNWYGPTGFAQCSLNLAESNTPPLNTSNCAGCTSMTVERRGYISHDHDARVSYVSTQYPLHPELFSIVRQACVRSLSCEVCPGREGPIFYGDNHRGHVLSHTFFLRDNNARGLQSWYSILIIMNDKIFLLNSWQFVVKNFQKIIHELQEKSAKVFFVEQAEKSQRVNRLSSVTRLTLDTFRRQRGNVKARSIVDLINDKTVFARLHLWFTWILKAGADRLCEKLAEGFPSEDTSVDLGRQEETEEGFIKIHIKKSPTENLPIVTNTTAKSEPKCSLEKDEIGVKFSSIRELYQVLGKEKFKCLAYHTAVGNQIIIKSKHLSLMKSIITCLQDLLPRGCYHPIYYSVSYEDSWKCNFLGILPEVHIPDHVHSSDLHIQLDVIKEGDEEEQESVHDFKFTFHSNSDVPDKIPQVVAEIERVIADTSFSISAMDTFIFTQKEMWMNKVKVLFAFSRGKPRSAEDANTLLVVLGAKDYDKTLLKFWMTGLSTQYKTEILSSTVQGKPDSKD